MKLSVKAFDSTTDCDGLCVGVYEAEPLAAPLSVLDKQLDGQLSNALKSKEFEGKRGQTLMLRGKTPYKRLLVMGLGKRKEVDGERIRELAGRSIAVFSTLKLKRVANALALGHNAVSQALAEGLVLATYRFDKYKTDEESKKSDVEEVTVLCEAKDVKSVSEAVEFGATLARIQNESRAVLNEPANVMTPNAVAKYASEMAKKHGLKCTVYGKEEIQKMKMNSFLSVARGSVEPPALVVLEKEGKGKPIAFVGKGITFDSGGISLKPSKDMDLMKFDKAGAIAVMGVLQAAAELDLPHHLIGVMALTENVPSGSASKPGDIVISRSGKTVEILNTDAEGRLVLADAISFACERDPQLVVDLATLTGAVVVALGEAAAGILGTDQKLMSQLQEAGDVTGERLWPLPLWPEYEEQVKSDFADVKNIGANGSAGTISGAAFIKAFVKDGIPWAHLDIAGTAWLVKEKPYMAKGGTGFGIRLLIEFLRRYKP